MAKYWGYVLVPHNTYLASITSTLNNGYNVDFTYGCQCWDFAATFWYNVGFPQGYPHITASSAYTMWNLRDQNKAYNGVTYFDLIYNLEDVKQGDVIVYNYFPGNQYGHVGFADEDYATWHANHPGNYEFPILSENNQGIPDPEGGAYVNVHGYDTRLFLGAFRYVEWETTPPTPPRQRIIKKSKFPWVLYANKLRNKM
jgi:hypothetical protein